MGRKIEWFATLREGGQSLLWPYGGGGAGQMPAWKNDENFR
jgi:hypothetical protein